MEQQYLNKQQESFCENAGLFGALLSLACLIQHMVFMIPNWITFSIIPVYILCIVSFVLLMKKQPVAALLLIVSAALILLLEVFMMLSLAFSLVLILLLLYLCVIAVVLYVGGTAAQLKKRQLALKEEAAKWNNIL